MVIDRDGAIYLALREGNALYRIDAEDPHLASPRRHRRTGLDGRWWSGSRGETVRAEGSRASGRNLYVADTESHTIRRVNLDTGIITTVLGAGVRGDGPETDPLQCKLSRPHGLFAAPDGTCTSPTAKRIAFEC